MNCTNAISRRRFLAMGAASAGAALVGRASRASNVLGANESIRLGFIGAGARGQELMAGFARQPHVQIAAVCDACKPRRAFAATASGATEVARWEDLVTRPDVDAVVIATPDHWHATMGVAALEAGKDVYCERPMALSIDDALRFRDTARRTGGVVQIGVQEASEGRWHAAREILADGSRLGRVVWSQGSYSRLERSVPVPAGTVSAQDLDWEAFHGSVSKQAFDPARFLNWRHYWDYSGGVATQCHYHKLVPLLLALGAGAPSRVSAAGGIYEQDGREVPDMFVMTLEYAAGYSIVLASSIATQRELPAVFRGERATLFAEPTGLGILNEEGDGVSESIPVAPTGDHLADWLRCIRERTAPVCGVDLGCDAAVAMALAVQSYRGSQAIYTETVLA